MLSNTHLLATFIVLSHAGSANAFANPSAASTSSFALHFAPRRNPYLVPSNSSQLERQSKLYAQRDENSEELTTVGSLEYYQGFLNRPVNEEPSERVTGDAVMGPILKFAGGAALILVVLTAAFLASNGII